MLALNGCLAAMAQPASQQDSIRLNAIPAKNLLHVTYITSTEGKAVFQLVDAAGRVYQAKEAGLRAGKNLISLNVAGVVPGSYLLRIIRGKSIRSMKLVIGASTGRTSFFQQV